MLNGEDPASLIRFGVYEADMQAGELRKHGLKLKLQEQPFRVLAMLLERPGHVVTRDDLQKSLWASDTFVDFDSGLNKAMNRLRDALADSAENPRFIETIPKRGYRFIAPVEKPGSAMQAPPLEPKQQSPIALPRNKAPWGVGLVLLAALVLGGLAWFEIINGRAASQPPQTIRSSLLPPPNTSFLPSNFELSPDGTRLAFVAAGLDGANMLWVRMLSVAGAQQLNGTEGARFPFWSPDNRYIGFFGAGKLRTVDLANGMVHTLCEAPAGMGGTWSRDGTIVFAPNIAGRIYRIAAGGGSPIPVTPMPPEGSGQIHTGPWFLPDGRHFLYFVAHSIPADQMGNGIYVGSLSSTAATLVSSELAGKVAFALGRLLYVRDGNLMAQPFNPSRLQTTGPPTMLAEQELEPDPGFWSSTFSVSQTGLIAFQSTNESPSHLQWTEASGKELDQISEAGYKDPSLSPDDRLLAAAVDDSHTGKRSIRVYDLARGVATRLTNGTNDRTPVWSRNGKEIAYGSRDGNQSYIYRVAADGSSPPELLLKGANIEPLDWSPDDDLLLGRLKDGHPDLAIYSMASHQVTPFANGVEAQFSPDGKWIAYVWRGVYVQCFPGPGPRIPISNQNGAQPRWSRDGRQLFYIAPDKKLMAVSFDSKKETAGAPRMLFPTRIVAPSFAGFQYDVAADGRLLINSLPSKSSFPLTLISEALR
jgi:Tol biopolymer transport system component/DNA-binding winged helix-turn-helix (wHTH) protein